MRLFLQRKHTVHLHLNDKAHSLYIGVLPSGNKGGKRDLVRKPQSPKSEEVMGVRWVNKMSSILKMAVWFPFDRQKQLIVIFHKP